MARLSLTAARVRELLRYDPSTGVFTNRINRSPKARAGSVAGCVSKSTGRTLICLDGIKDYQASRLAWLYMTGAWPSGDIDHIDGDQGNNRFSNLRDVSEKLNMQNLKAAHQDSSTGYLGVSEHVVRTADGGKVKKFRARIYVDGKNRNIGVFESPVSAHRAYLKAKRALHPGCTI